MVSIQHQPRNLSEFVRSSLLLSDASSTSVSNCLSNYNAEVPSSSRFLADSLEGHDPDTEAWGSSDEIKGTLPSQKREGL